MTMQIAMAWPRECWRVCCPRDGRSPQPVYHKTREDHRSLPGGWQGTTVAARLLRLRAVVQIAGP